MSFSSRALQELDGLLAEFRDRLEQSERGGVGTVFTGTDFEKEAAHARLRSAVERWSLPGSSYRQDVQRIEANKASAGLRAVSLYGLIQGLREDYAAGYTQSVEELVHADLFADFLEMARGLVDRRFKDPAAVLAGSVLEEHLRKLASKTGVSVTDAKGKPRKADTINAELAKQRTYNTLEQKSVVAWLDLRNRAAHGEYDQYDNKQVSNLIDAVRDFLVRHPA